MHTSSLQTSFDHDFIGAFHRSAADGPALGLKEMILHLRPPFLQISQRLGQLEFLGIRVSLDQALQFIQEQVRSCMFELVQPVLKLHEHTHLEFLPQ